MKGTGGFDKYSQTAIKTKVNERDIILTGLFQI